MIQNNDEKKYEDVIQKLKNLQKIDAPDYFEADLKRRIGEIGPSGKKSFWEKFILPSRLIPSAGLAGAAIIIFFVVNINSEELDNPFLIEPRERADVFEVDNTEQFTTTDEIQTQEKPAVRRDLKDEKLRSVGESKAGREEVILKKEALDDDNLFAESDSIKPESTYSAAPEPASVQLTVGGYQAESNVEITKEELNFRQIQLNEQEQQVVNELRTKMQTNQQKKADYQK